MNVVELWRYPVKSMGGEQLDQAMVTIDGVHGDRMFGVVDRATGFVLTARRVPQLLLASAQLTVDGDLMVTLPDGSITRDDDDLSDWLGRPVALRSAEVATAGRYETQLDFEHEDTAEWFSWEGPTGPFHDSTRARVSLVSEATIGVWDRRRFRANVVLSPGDEDALVGTTTRVGSVELDVLKQIDRCVMVTRRQPDGIARDLDVLRTINRDRGGFLAIGALVRTPGRLAVGDELRT